MPPAPEFDVVFLNGEILPASSAGVSFFSPAFRYGATCFEGIKAYWHADRSQLLLFRLGDHLVRLQRSSTLMRFDDVPPPATIEQGAMHFLHHIAPRETCHVRVYFFIDGDGPMWATGPVSWGISVIPTPRAAHVGRGIHCAISSWQRISDLSMPPRIKAAANYNNGRLASVQAKQDGYDNALLLTGRGTIAESPGSCFFMLRDSVLVTPPVTDSILESITRDTVIRLARQHLGLTVEERSIDRTEACIADEAFLAGSAQELTPVLSIDRIALGKGVPGPITRALQDAYFATVLGEITIDPSWITTV